MGFHGYYLFHSGFRKVFIQTNRTRIARRDTKVASQIADCLKKDKTGSSEIKRYG